ncbi:MAG: hypothetical protein KJO01_13960 [Gammaproteobacteria bacterium]|nr:hypothetical protein [Gammaproteobacteria bacterium]MBT8109774.1 hypothetical protein [Gammaproteobacteria bacterium]NNL44476.1 hypothetical protein [Woeseiaceae bacterium]
MDILTLTAFFMWYTIIVAAVLTGSTIFLLFASNFMYRKHNKWFPMPRESFNLVLYSSLVMLEIVFVVFCVAPFLALLIVG